MMAAMSCCLTEPNNHRAVSPVELPQKSTLGRPKDTAIQALPACWRESPGNPEERLTLQEELAFKDQTVYSYQQISCLDSVIR